MEIRKKLAFLIAVMSTGVYGATMSLDQVLKEVRNNSYEIKVFERNADLRRIEEKKAFKDLFPGVDISASNDLLQNDRYKDGIEVLKPQKVQMPVTIYSGGRKWNNYKARQLDSTIAQKDLVLTEQAQEIRAIELYFGILNLQKQIEITNTTKKTLKKQEERLNILFSNGKMISKNELLEVRADIKGIEAELLRYRNQIKFNKEELVQLMGYQSEIEVEEYAEVFAPRDIQEDKTKLVNQNSTIQKRKLEIEKARLDVKDARSAFLPTVTITPEYDIDSDGGNNGDRWAVQLGASMNLFQWGATLDDIKSKKTLLEIRELEHEDTIKTLERDLRSRYRELELLGQEVKIAQERVNLLYESSKIQDIRFSKGMISSLDYLESVQLLRVAEENRYALEKSLILANREYANLLK